MDDEKLMIADALIRLRILETEGVRGIVEYKAINDCKSRTIYVTISTEFGKCKRGGERVSYPFKPTIDETGIPCA